MTNFGAGIKHTEHGEQSALFDWALGAQYQYPELALMFAVPNGGARAITTARKLKAEGVRAGVPDIFLPAPRGNKHGLFVELKVGRNRPSEIQQAWIDSLQEQDYAVEVCYGFDEAQAAIVKYLEGK